MHVFHAFYTLLNFPNRLAVAHDDPVVHHHDRSFIDIVRVVQQRNPDQPKKALVRLIIEEHSVEDGITLCKVCHDEYHREHGK